MINGEPTEQVENSAELFPVGSKLSELVAEFPREEIQARLAEIVIGTGELTADFYRETSDFIEGIKATTHIDWEKAVDENEKHAL